MPTDLARLYDTHAPAVFGFALNLTGSEAEARDVLQEVFRRLARRPELLEGVDNARAFLLRLAHNQAVDHMRRRTVRDKAHDRAAAEANGFAPGANPDEDAFRRALAAALAELPAEQRAVAHLKLWEHQTFEQIAGTLGVSPHTAASRYRYALDKLRARLRPLYDEIKPPWTSSKNS